MKIVVTGSIAYDYLMSFPGKFTDQIVPDKLARLSVSSPGPRIAERRQSPRPKTAACPRRLHRYR